MQKDEHSDEEKLRQLLLINKLAKRLPWIIVGVSLIAFLVIFLQVIFKPAIAL